MSIKADRKILFKDTEKLTVMKNGIIKSVEIDKKKNNGFVALLNQLISKNKC